MPLCLTPQLAHDRLRAPAEHLGVLVEPAPVELRSALTRGFDPALARVRVSGRPLETWRAELRAQLGLPTGPLVVTGHQCEFVHAGVFAKIVAASVLAENAAGMAVFLEADADLPKAAHLPVPEITSHGLRRVNVPIPGCDPRQALESQSPQRREHWLEFFVRIASVYEHYEASLLPVFAEAWLACEAEQIHIVEGMARGRAALEDVLALKGVRTVRLSRLCATPAFRAFACDLLLNAEAVAQAYNTAQAAYRRRYRVRNANRPMPPLARLDERIEVPLWAWPAAGPRERVFVRPGADRVEVFAGATPLGALPAAPPAATAFDHPFPFEQTGWRLRPRASTLAAFARLFLADLFIHGVGGAKYDEITDDWLQRRFGVTPPLFGCVTATLHLPLPRTGARVEQWQEARRRSRDIRFNPQRYLSNLPPELLRRRAEMIRRSDELRCHQPRDHATRRAVWAEIRRLNEHLLEHDPWRAAELDQQVHALAENLRLDRVAFDREYFVALHLRRTLAELVDRLRRHLRS